MQEEEMHVIKRNGNTEIVSFDKILKRIKNIGTEAKLSINYTSLAMKVIDQLYNGIDTSKLDELTAEQCASLSTNHPDYGTLASRLVISNLHKKTSSSFIEVINELYNFRDVNNNHVPLISFDIMNIVNTNKDFFQSSIDYNRDYLIDYFGFKTLERAYLMKKNKIILERPQHMWMRVALGIHFKNFSLEAVKETYDLMSLKYFTHATPTLFNAGTPRPQLSSCYLISMENDSVDGIFNTLKECALISKWSGGIGLHIHNIRSSGSHIRGTNGVSNGLIPMLGVFNKTARYIDQGGKRNGSFAIYLEPHHPDIEDFLDLKKNHGDEELRARDLFYALWVSDLFMERVKTSSTWSLFCPDKCPGLSDAYGDEYKQMYLEYENRKMYTKQISARELWIKVLDAQMETGTPYLLYKDAANIKSNQKNLGTIKSSNLCTEILEYSDEKETAVCNLASISLTKCVIENYENPFKNVVIYTKNNCNWCLLLKALLKKKYISYEEISVDESNRDKLVENENGVKTLPQLFDNGEFVGGFDNVLNILRNKFDYDKLHYLAKVLTKNLNNIIDINFYPTQKTERSNLLHRPIGIGVQGFADALILMDIPFESDAAREINKKIFETIYHGALESSCEISQLREKKLKKMKEGLQNNDWCYLSKDNDVCTSYLVNQNTGMDYSYMIEESLNRIRPIPKEINREKYLGSYSSFEGSPISKGNFQFDLWNIQPSERYDWEKLRNDILTYGIRNSLLVAPMPTASTSQILGNNECFEPLTSNIYSRRTLAGEFVVVNKYLIHDLMNINMWNENIKNNIILNKGSIQYIEEIPKFIKEKYKIVWEIPMKHIIDMAKERGPFICQSQSMNLWVEDPDPKILTNMHFYSWKSGLKTGIYYLRRKPKHQPQQFTIEPENKKKKYNNDKTSKEEDTGECLMCSG